ncbi:MAG: hypothetical protein R3E89_19720 [Thiolinea sp.]
MLPRRRLAPGVLELSPAPPAASSAAVTHNMNILQGLQAQDTIV